jgi:hypothetical protein
VSFAFATARGNQNHNRDRHDRASGGRGSQSGEDRDLCLRWAGHDRLRSAGTWTSGRHGGQRPAAPSRTGTIRHTRDQRRAAPEGGKAGRQVPTLRTNRASQADVLRLAGISPARKD